MISLLVAIALAAPPRVSPVQQLIDRAPAGATVIVPPGTWEGDLLIEKPVRLVGRGRPLLLGSGRGTVVSIVADGTTLEGFAIDGRGGGDLGEDASGIHIEAHRVAVRDCAIRRTLFGVYLREANDAVVDGCVIRGIRGKAPGEKGSGIHVWNTDGFRITRNDIRDVRDGIYIQSSYHGFISRNHASDLRYGLHFMFSDDHEFTENTFENGDAGTAIMYARRINFRRNRFVRNRGFASVGLLFKECDDGISEDNLIADNARGIFLEGSYRNVFRRNVVAESDAAIVLFDSSSGNRFEGNIFSANLAPLTLVGRRTDTVFEGNYWTGNREPDLDGDGRSDRPYVLSSLFDHLRENVTAADLFAGSVAARAIAAAEATFPVIDPSSVVDRAPLVRPPALPAVPRRDRRPRAESIAGIATSAALMAAGLLVIARRRP
ncbi:MAG TPA: nitrous oxide reductase family maturation protein NosD [Thermoanaerobaculia bacterium]